MFGINCIPINTKIINNTFLKLSILFVELLSTKKMMFLVITIFMVGMIEFIIVIKSFKTNRLLDNFQTIFKTKILFSNILNIDIFFSLLVLNFTTTNPTTYQIAVNSNFMFIKK